MANKTPTSPFPIKLKNIAAHNHKDGALKLHRMGFNVIPLLSDQKRPPCKWSVWEKNQSEKKIIEYWIKHPTHEVGILTNDKFIVFDADTDASLKALYRFEKKFGIKPFLIVKTKKGEHHYFKIPNDVMAKQASFSSVNHPECIDMKTGRSLVAAPPSSNKSFIRCDISHIDELSEVSQAFVDAVCKHNGREPAEKVSVFQNNPQPDKKRIRNFPDKEIDAYLEHIPADISYEEWTKVGMSLHHEYEGSEDGLERYDQWSSNGETYPGRRSIETKWKSFSGYADQPLTASFMKKLAKEHGANVDKLAIEANFEICQTTIVYPDGQQQIIPPLHAPVSCGETVVSKTRPKLVCSKNPLARYAINDQLDYLKSQASQAVFVLENLAIKSQITNVYAKPNTGKTLITLKSLTEQITCGTISGDDVYYINADDSYNGLIEKLELLKKFKINVLAPGHKGFDTRQIRKLIRDLSTPEHAKNTVLLIDTLKKVTDVMSKGDSSTFFRLLRQFSAQGGTVITLAHTNKNDGPDGRPVYGGTTDSLDDTDCAYTMARIDNGESDYAIVEFNNIKNRGNVCQKAYFRYSRKEGQSYAELFNSVEEVAPEDIQSSMQGTKGAMDESAVILAITDYISEGKNQKMELVKEASALLEISQKKVQSVLEKFTGNNPELHHWNFKTKARGAKVFELLMSTDTSELNTPDIQHGSFSEF